MINDCIHGCVNSVDAPIARPAGPFRKSTHSLSGVCPCRYLACASALPSRTRCDLCCRVQASSFEEETKRASQGMGMGMGKGISQMDLLQAAGGLLLVGGDSTNVPLKKRKGPSPGGG